MNDEEWKIRQWYNHIPTKYRGTYVKAITGESLRKAVTAKCQDCMCWNSAEVGRCDIVTCPLHPYRGNGRVKRSPDIFKDL